jgi:hypothetical protein
VNRGSNPCRGAKTNIINNLQTGKSGLDILMSKW